MEASRALGYHSAGRFNDWNIGIDICNYISDTLYFSMPSVEPWIQRELLYSEMS